VAEFHTKLLELSTPDSTKPRRPKMLQQKMLAKINHLWQT